MYVFWVFIEGFYTRICVYLFMYICMHSVYNMYVVYACMYNVYVHLLLLFLLLFLLYSNYSTIVSILC